MPPLRTGYLHPFPCRLVGVVPNALIVSGLAYGIDIHAHRAALQNHFKTIGVLAHGLDRIYPAEHRKTAVSMLEQGGLLTEFTSGTNPDRRNFVKRNRIVAGMSDATVVIESAAKGGASSPPNWRKVITGTVLPFRDDTTTNIP